MNYKTKYNLCCQKQLEGTAKVKDFLRTMKSFQSVNFLDKNYEMKEDTGMKKTSVPKRLLKETCEVNDYCEFTDTLELRLLKYEFTK